MDARLISNIAIACHCAVADLQHTVTLVSTLVSTLVKFQAISILDMSDHLLHFDMYKNVQLRPQSSTDTEIKQVEFQPASWTCRASDGFLLC